MRIALGLLLFSVLGFAAALALPRRAGGEPYLMVQWAVSYARSADEFPAVPLIPPAVRLASGKSGVVLYNEGSRENHAVLPRVPGTVVSRDMMMVPRGEGEWHLLRPGYAPHSVTVDGVPRLYGSIPVFFHHDTVTVYSRELRELFSFRDTGTVTTLDAYLVPPGLREEYPGEGDRLHSGSHEGGGVVVVWGDVFGRVHGVYHTTGGEHRTSFVQEPRRPLFQEGVATVYGVRILAVGPHHVEVLVVAGRAPQEVRTLEWQHTPDDSQDPASREDPLRENLLHEIPESLIIASPPAMAATPDGRAVVSVSGGLLVVGPPDALAPREVQLLATAQKASRVALADRAAAGQVVVAEDSEGTVVFVLVEGMNPLQWTFPGAVLAGQESTVWFMERDGLFLALELVS